METRSTTFLRETFPWRRRKRRRKRRRRRKKRKRRKLLEEEGLLTLFTTRCCTLHSGFNATPTDPVNHQLPWRGGFREVL